MAYRHTGISVSAHRHYFCCIAYSSIGMHEFRRLDSHVGKVILKIMGNHLTATFAKPTGIPPEEQ